ncbi:hypothetical protein FUA23_19350 [Neolewinella aurantiaca]|uniref:Uncharacterized protein n=1 Tax=Neolewinella aurantiaca TaxID=2602767 RepID=A0A5C7F7I2_9BACT|nr:hypothetical protein [Neolewinella aurantiaca]TXF86661.1 hypothetical protein FUA23_19350 [Neolewinella aurantiaca]
MDTHFQSLLQIRLQHDYFSDGNCRDLVLVPSPLTAQLMESMTVRMVARNYGTELFYGETDDHPNPLKNLKAPLRLSFWLRTATPLLYNYTNHLPEAPSSSLLYFTNYGQGSAKIFSANPDALTGVVSPVSEWEVSNNPAEAWVADENGDALPDGAAMPGPGSSTRVDIMSAGLQAGRYFLRDGEEATPFLPKSDGYQVGDIGLLSITLGDTGDGNHAILAPDGSIDPAVYTISFSARSTFWRYYIIGRTVNLEKLSISSEGDSPEFRVPTPPTRPLANGSEAAVLVSASPIPLRFRPPERFLLTYTDEAGNIHPDAILLPNAGGEQVTRDEHDPTVFYSDMFVYL